MNQPNKWKSLEKPKSIYYVCGIIIFYFVFSGYLCGIIFTYSIKAYELSPIVLLTVILLSSLFSIYLSIGIIKGRKLEFKLTPIAISIFLIIRFISFFTVIYTFGLQTSSTTTLIYFILIYFIPIVLYCIILYAIKKTNLKTYFG
jgi:hypothetical protein